MSQAHSPTETLSREEVLAKYGEVDLFFSAYYKYSFGFSGIADDGVKVYMCIGGDSGDIYRFIVSRDEPKKLKDMEWGFARVSRDDQEIWSEST